MTKREAKAFEYPKTAEAIPASAHPLERADKTDGGRICYQCPQCCAEQHFEAWKRERRNGNKSAPEPMPDGHLMFERPTGYGYVELGCTDTARIRAALESTVRGMLSGGWDSDIPKDTFDKIVAWTVDRKLAGLETGGVPFVACLSASM